MKRLDPQRILVIRLADIGDLLTAMPALRALRTTYQAARLDLLTTPQAAAAAPPSLADSIIAAPRSLAAGPGDAPALGRLLWALRRSHYDAVLFLHHLTLWSGALKYRLLAAVSGAPVLAGLDNGRGGWLTHPVPDLGFGAMHEVEYCLQVAARVGARPADLSLAVRREPADEADANRLLLGLSGQFLAAIHPGSGGYAPARRWEASKWAEVADALAERHGARIILVGTAADGVDAVQAAMHSPALNLAGQTTLPQLAALLGRCDLFLGADSGIMHLAAAVGTPVVALFGPSNPQAWAPWTAKGRSIVVRLGLGCSPCSYVGHGVGQRDGCWHRACLADLQPAAVLDAVAALGLLGPRSEGR